jgi:NADP-dependent 3-hydroxy acid dehydrogenase YdfG
VLDDNRLDGKVALVTGAGGEIGEATIRVMAARGARIVAVDRDAGSLQRLSAALPELNLVTCEADSLTRKRSADTSHMLKAEPAASISSLTTPASRGRCVRLPSTHSLTSSASSTST